MRLFRRLTIKKIIILSLLCFFISSCIYFFSAKLFEKSAYDTVVKITSNKKGSANIVNVVIDENSIKEVAPWPWKRTSYADLFNYIEDAGAKIIVFDAILTAQGEQSDDNEFLRRIRNSQILISGTNFSKNENTQNKKEELDYFANKFALKVTDNRSFSYKNKTKYISYQEMFPLYIKTVQTIGAVNTALDTDGSVRAFEPIIYMQGKYYPSLPLAVFLKLNNYKEIIIYNNKYEVYNDSGLIAVFPLFSDKDKSVQYIKWLTPYDANSWIPHKQIKASDIIKSYKNIKVGEYPVIPQEELKDKIVVVGATANALYDLKITPLTVNMPGSTIQATIIDNLLSNQSIKIISPFVNIIVMLIYMGVIAFAILKLQPIFSVIALFGLCFLYFYMVLFCYSNGFAINIITPYIFYVLMSIMLYSYKFSVEDYKKEKLKHAMKQYIGNNIVDDIIKNQDEEVKLGGKKSEVTILMADIRGFTKFSENLEPDEVTNLLNEYFGQMIPIIEQHGGAVNKFIGDAILAVFNEPIKDAFHAQNAILCATKMLSKLQEIRKKWKSEGKPNIGISIGINTGQAFIGNIGTPDHLEYTVIGDTVNVASRIEAQNRQFNTQILISETTYEYAKDILDVIKISSVPIRGREKNIDIYEIINILDKNETN